MNYSIDDFDLLQADEFEEDFLEDYVDYPRRTSGHSSYDFSADVDYEERYRNFLYNKYGD
jgi:hypothetical protein